jgi:hypothetical protein
MTKTEFLTMIANNNDLDIIIREFAKQELARFQHPIAVDKWHDLKCNILNEMQEGVWYTVCDMQREFDCCNGLTVQKISALVSQMVETKQIIKSEKPGERIGTVRIFKLA